MSLTPDTPPVLDQLLAELAQESNPRRRRQLLQARADLWRQPIACGRRATIEYPGRA